ncbi:MAG: hypothetical protein PVS2B2_20820 [Candidatus Acidiferrum sp.]
MVLPDTEFLAAFETAELPEGSFHHADHVHAGWIHLSRHPLPEAIARFSAALQRFALAKGKPGLYHETITWAYLLLIHERMRRASMPQRWEEFAAENPELLDSPKKFLSRCYSEKLLDSLHARRVFVFPDRIEQSLP